MKSRLTYLLCMLILLAACNSPKELAMTAVFSANNRSSEIDKRVTHDYLTRLFEYRVFKKTITSNQYHDSTISFGIVFPRYWISKQHLEEEMIFGKDTTTCILQYNTDISTSNRKRNSLVGDLISKKPSYSSNDETETARIYLYITGTIFSPLFKDSIAFRYEDPGDPEMIRGQLIVGSDRFIIKPIFEATKYAAPKLMGLELLKGDNVYAMVQRFPDNLFKRNKLFLYTLATDNEQFLMAAYFAIVDWYL